MVVVSRRDVSPAWGRFTTMRPATPGGASAVLSHYIRNMKQDNTTRQNKING